LAVFVTALCIGDGALKRAGLDLAVGIAFPFAVGLAIGEIVSFPHSLWGRRHHGAVCSGLFYHGDIVALLWRLPIRMPRWLVFGWAHSFCSLAGPLWQQPLEAGIAENFSNSHFRKSDFRLTDSGFPQKVAPSPRSRLSSSLKFRHSSEQVPR